MLFKLKKHKDIDKHLTVEGPDLTMKIDFDDVDQRATLRATRKMVALLNEHWNGEVNEDLLAAVRS